MNAVVGGPLAVPPAIAVPSATGVDAQIVLAGPGARAMAFVIDWLLRGALTAVYLIAASFLLLGNLRAAVVTAPVTHAVIGAGAVGAGPVRSAVVWPGASVAADEELENAIRAGGGLTVAVR